MKKSPSAQNTHGDLLMNMTIKEKTGQILWTPTPQQIEKANITHFARQAIVRWGKNINTYLDFYRWSVEHADEFWLSVWEHIKPIAIETQVKRRQGLVSGLDAGVMVRKGNTMDTQWFPGFRLNFTQNLLRKRDSSDAVLYWRGERTRRRITWSELNNQVSRCAQGMKVAGIHAGDRVAGLIENEPDAIVVMLSAIALGAIWVNYSSSLSQEQIIENLLPFKPKMLFAAEGYYQNQKFVQHLDKISAIAVGVPSLLEVIVIPEHGSISPTVNTLNVDGIPRGLIWSEFAGPFKATQLDYPHFPLSHPVCVFFTEDSNGKIKSVVHGAGHLLLKGWVEHHLHGDIHNGDRVLGTAPPGTPLWLWNVTTLLSGATLILYQGDTWVGGENILNQIIKTEKVTHVSISAEQCHDLLKHSKSNTPSFLLHDADTLDTHYDKEEAFLDSNKNHSPYQNEKIEDEYLDADTSPPAHPLSTHLQELSRLRAILLHGQPILPGRIQAIHAHIKPNIYISTSISSVDTAGSLAMGVPVLPLRSGEVSSGVLGVEIRVANEKDVALRAGKMGQMLSARPFPAIPLGVWEHESGSYYPELFEPQNFSYWHHGQYAERALHGGIIPYGNRLLSLNTTISSYDIIRSVARHCFTFKEAIAVSYPHSLDTPFSSSSHQPKEVSGSPPHLIVFLQLLPKVYLDQDRGDYIRKGLRKDIKLDTAVPIHICQVRDTPRTLYGSTAAVLASKLETLHTYPKRIKNIYWTNTDCLIEYHRIWTDILPILTKQTIGTAEELTFPIIKNQ